MYIIHCSHLGAVAEVPDSDSQIIGSGRWNHYYTGQRDSGLLLENIR